MYVLESPLVDVSSPCSLQRYTDDPVHDPYAATRGLWWCKQPLTFHCGLYLTVFSKAHMGWIFFKPNYERMELVDRQDLDHDPIVRFQHKYYCTF
jgi:stearoyl-CoA desaturase (delta-9 desaturase)